jgi:hypothetical protein
MNIQIPDGSLPVDSVIPPSTGYGLEVNTFVGLGIQGDPVITVVCPCNVTAYINLNSIPREDTPHPCGHPDHWLVKYYSSKES